MRRQATDLAKNRHLNSRMCHKNRSGDGQSKIRVEARQSGNATAQDIGGERALGRRNSRQTAMNGMSLAHMKY